MTSYAGGARTSYGHESGALEGSDGSDGALDGLDRLLQHADDPETIVLRTCGIDIGSATTQLVVSVLLLRRMGRGHSSEYRVVGRESEYLSPVGFTPYLGDGRIDAGGLKVMLDSWLRSGEVNPKFDSGVVILTGEAVRRENSAAIAEEISFIAGDFVCAAAGDLFEVEMAARGSGAMTLSAEQPDVTVMNVDIGGGTTKISVIRGGSIVDKGVVRLGARAVVVDESERITRLDLSGGVAAEMLGVPVAVGAGIAVDDRRQLSQWLIDRLDEFVFGKGGNEPGAGELHITEPMGLRRDDIDVVVFSSGVAEYLSDPESRQYGDLGPFLAAAVGELFRQPEVTWKVVISDQPIRATALGISQHTVQVSGDTVYVAQATTLPVRNRRLVDVDISAVDEAEVVATIRAAMTKGGVEAVGDGGWAWRLALRDDHRYPYISGVARALAAAAEELVSGTAVIILDADLAMTIGRLMVEELELVEDVVVLDGLRGEADFVDVGNRHEASGTVPLVMKAFLFDELSAS